MKKTATVLLMLAASTMMFACTNSRAQQKTDEPQAKAKSGEVIVMNKQMFVDRVFDYATTQDWNYKGDKPAIIDLYADWCGPCRMTAPIMKELAKEYDGKITIYKVNVDKERELAALFNATSIPLFVFIPMNEQPQLFRGAADKATYKKVIDDFLLKQ
ncbi:MAG: redoxin domain-containing protein [Prevotellaceae bacterium]|jgi:thioredoxin|nr:redoxin domain-containing protein [Prevotellaceae bacterium]